MSLAYVLGDTVDKGYKDYSEGKGVVAVGKMSLDVLLWQTLASVAVPGLTINIAVSQPCLCIFFFRSAFFSVFSSVAAGVVAIVAAALCMYGTPQSRLPRPA